MTCEPIPNDVRAVWQSQTTEKVDMSAEQLRQNTQKLRRTVLWRNLREYVAAAYLIAIFGYFLWKFDTPLLRLASGATIAGALFVVYHLHKWGSAKPLPMEMAFSTCLDCHRKELERQRDLLRSVWTWYLLPFVPGMVLFLLGLFRFTVGMADVRSRGGVVAILALVFGAVAVICTCKFVAIGKLNESAARKFQAEIDALDALEKES